MAINNKALKKAWQIRWKKQIDIKYEENITIITPNWLRVDRATIFLILVSLILVIPAIKLVKNPKKKKNF